MKKKLNLNDLKVDSFVIDNKGLNSQTVKGGREVVESYVNWCPGDPSTDPVGELTKPYCTSPAPYDCYVSGNSCNF